MKDQLAHNLKLLRGKSTQNEWAEKFGVNKMTVSVWERGLRWPKRSQLLKIAAKNKLRVGDLFRENLFIEGEIIREPKTEYASDLIAAYADPEIQDTVRLLRKWSKDLPEVNIPQFLKRLSTLPGEKQEIILQLVEAMS